MAGLLDLKGKRGLVVGLANGSSIAYGCARKLREAGAELIVTYKNEKTREASQIVARSLGAMSYPCDVQKEEQVNELFTKISARWDQLDFLVHSIAFAPKADLNGRVTDASLSGFLTAMDISCHSFARLAKEAEPLISQGGSLLTISYHGAEKVVPHYNLMGPVKAALECMVRYMAAELGPQGIRVNAISPGAIATRAAYGIDHFEELLHQAATKAPMQRSIDLNDIGNLAAFLASDLAKNITGGVHYVDAGYEVMD